MMLLELLQSEFARLHSLLDACVDDLTADQWHSAPAGNARANTIAFEIWHYTRTEDNIVRFVLQARRPTVWLEGGWPERLALPPIAQGTGMPAEEAQRLRIDDTAAFQSYMQAAWRSTAEYLAEAGASGLDREVVVRPFGPIPAARALGQVCLSHGFSHYGEIELARTLMGLAPAGEL